MLASFLRMNCETSTLIKPSLVLQAYCWRVREKRVIKYPQRSWGVFMMQHSFRYQWCTEMLEGIDLQRSILLCFNVKK